MSLLLPPDVNPFRTCPKMPRGLLFVHETIPLAFLFVPVKVCFGKGLHLDSGAVVLEGSHVERRCNERCRLIHRPELCRQGRTCLHDQMPEPSQRVNDRS